MSELTKSFCVYVVIGMGIGFSLLLLAYVYWKAFEQIVNTLGMNKEFIQFIWDKRRKSLKPKPKMQ